MSERERKRWEETVNGIIESHKEFLIFVASEKRSE